MLFVACGRLCRRSNLVAFTVATAPARCTSRNNQNEISLILSGNVVGDDDWPAALDSRQGSVNVGVNCG